MEALTQCWFTRIHRPERERHRESDGSITSSCKYCHRPLVSWDRVHWNLANGIDVSRLAELATGRVLTVIDTLDELILRRFSVGHLETEEEVDAFKAELRAEFGLDEPGSTLELRDSAPRRAKRKAPPPVIATPPVQPGQPSANG